MTPKEAAQRIRTHNEIHSRKEPFAVHITEALRMAVDALERQRWIPVTERLPDKDGIYIVRTVHGTLTTARFYAYKYFPATKYLPAARRIPSWQAYRNVTHWMPLPEPPKGE